MRRPRSPDLLAAMATSKRASADLLAVLDDPKVTPAALQRAADVARRSMNELWTLASCDVGRRGGSRAA